MRPFVSALTAASALLAVAPAAPAATVALESREESGNKGGVVIVSSVAVRGSGLVVRLGAGGARSAGGFSMPLR